MKIGGGRVCKRLHINDCIGRIYIYFCKNYLSLNFTRSCCLEL